MTVSPCLRSLASSHAGGRLNVSRLVWPRMKRPPGRSVSGSAVSSSSCCAKEAERRPVFSQIVFPEPQRSVERWSAPSLIVRQPRSTSI